MDNFSVRSERNFHNLTAKPKRMHLLDEPSGYTSALVKNGLSHQMRFTIQKLEEELCAAGNLHVLQIKLLKQMMEGDYHVSPRAQEVRQRWGIGERAQTRLSSKCPELGDLLLRPKAEGRQAF